MIIKFYNKDGYVTEIIHDVTDFMYDPNEDIFYLSFINDSFVVKRDAVARDEKHAKCRCIF